MRCTYVHALIASTQKKTLVAFGYSGHAWVLIWCNRCMLHSQPLPPIILSLNIWMLSLFFLADMVNLNEMSIALLFFIYKKKFRKFVRSYKFLKKVRWLLKMTCNFVLVTYQPTNKMRRFRGSVVIYLVMKKVLVFMHIYH